MITTRKITAQEMIDKGIAKAFYINSSIATVVVALALAAGTMTAILGSNSTLVAILFK